MLRMIEEFYDVVVISIRTGEVAGKVSSAIIKPDGLSIAGFFVKPLRERSEKVLVVSDIREIGLGGLIIDDEEKLMDLEDLVRIQALVEIDYQIVGKKVETDKKRKIGKVQDFAVDDLTWNVQKIYPSRGILKEFSTTGTIIDREQIVEVNDKKIIVKDVDINSAEPVVATQPTG
jgi:uncharacterized protein YrrD